MADYGLRPNPPYCGLLRAEPAVDEDLALVDDERRRGGDLPVRAQEQRLVAAPVDLLRRVVVRIAADPVRNVGHRRDRGGVAERVAVPLDEPRAARLRGVSEIE